MKKRLLSLILSAALTLPLLSALPALPSFARNAKNAYDFTGLYLTREQISIRQGGSYTLTPRLIDLPKGEIVWTSADPTVAAVSESGEVSALALGQTVVTATLGDSSASCRVIVTDRDPVQAEYEHTMELMQDFLDLRFGMFLHFNSATYEFAAKGGDWGGESYQSTFKPTSWNPSKLDCRDWAKAAKSAGMRFAVLTSKHHDGFDLWDSAYTDYDVGAAKDKTDVIAAFTEGCRAEGILPGIYFSMLDVKHQITSSSCTPSDVEFIKAQIRELLTGYGEIPFLIFDGWNAYWGGPHYDTLPYEEIVNLVHSIQPDCLVINISCEANNTRSQIAMFESAAGQHLPDWFDNVNISCNTPTENWFWRDNYTSATFKDADWVLNQNVNPFAESNTVFILNCSPNKQGVLIEPYKKLLSEIGQGYEKPADTVEIPARWAADYDYRSNLLFRKEAVQSSTSGERSSSNAPAIRAVDGFTDPIFDHAVSSRTNTGLNEWWMADVGYSADLGSLHIYLGDGSAATVRKATVYLSEKPFGTPNAAALAADPAVRAYPLSSGQRSGDCVSFDLSGVRGRYLCILSGGNAALTLSEVILTPASVKSDPDANRITACRDRLADLCVPVGTAPADLGLPESGNFVCADGSPLRAAIAWDFSGCDFQKSGDYTLIGRPQGSDFTLEVPITLTAAGDFTQIAVKSVSTISQWAQADSLGWANVKNLISTDGLTISSENFLYSTHDNPYNATTMWHSADNVTTASLTFDLGAEKSVSDALIWNHNQLNLTDRGVKELEIFYTQSENPSDSDWISVGKFTLSRAGGSAYEPASGLLHLGQIDARKIRFDLLTNYGSRSQIGLSQAVFLSSGPRTADSARLVSLISAFSLLSVYDYPSGDYAALKAVCDQAKSALSGDESGTDLADLCERMESGLAALADKRVPAAVEGLHGGSLSVPLGQTAFPETLELKIGGKSVSAPILWEGDPAVLFAKKGSVTLRGRVADTPYTVTLAAAVRGTSSDALVALVERYGQISPDGLDPDAFAAFGSALAAARAALADPAATQEQIDQAKSALKKAKYALYNVKSADFDPSGTPGTPENPGNPGDPADSGDSGANSGDPADSNRGEGRPSAWIGVLIGSLAGAAILGGSVFAILAVKRRKKS